MTKHHNNDMSSDGAFRIDVNEAERLINAAMPTYGTARVALLDSAGQILRQDIHAERDQPPFDRATMDGIAVNSQSLNKPVPRFDNAGILAAGAEAKLLPSMDSCLEIMTGAVVPSNADTVIPVERIRPVAGDTQFELEPGYLPQAGQFIHRRASDHSRGDTILTAGTRIRGPEMAILTAAGDADVTVAEWPRVAIISTGDELVDVGVEIKDSQIRSSNDRAIETTLRLRGCSRTTRARLPDDPEELLKSIARLHDYHDVLILSGGVSMGKYDYVPTILKELGVRLLFHKILQRPGLPMWFGVSASGKPVFALPGNPVSTLVCHLRYVIPAIETAMQLKPQEPALVTLADTVQFEPDLCWFLPVRLTSQGAVPCPTNTSGDFIGLRGTDGFVELPRGKSDFPAGFRARFFGW